MTKDDKRFFASIIAIYVFSVGFWIVSLSMTFAMIALGYPLALAMCSVFLMLLSGASYATFSGQNMLAGPYFNQPPLGSTVVLAVSLAFPAWDVGSNWSAYMEPMGTFRMVGLVLFVLLPTLIMNLVALQHRKTGWSVEQVDLDWAVWRKAANGNSLH
eukprot:CAMPEP_0174707666 /NCGR_PEP_ID=MMETSP1094-20130205/10122_1 /TAXON_ID=156173 /ORGANISM="Chrysochromulina brevifilum, Strain UTEX LB 985" /LENGTH=157 /DNA_ID=CAMNT_0015906081 /DNA_START=62 /DNA_END=535 /DNA_ORIENTATION=-